MCSNRAIVDSVECYVDDLVECFEDFVKKSLIIMSIGVAIIVGMLTYMLRVVSERSPISNIIAEDAVSAHNQIRNMTVHDNARTEQTFTNTTHQRNFVRNSDVRIDKGAKVRTNTGVNTNSGIAPLPSFDEKILRDIGLSSCSKPGWCARTNSQSYIPCRVPIPSLTPPKRKLVHAIRPSKHYIPPFQILPRTVSKQEPCCSLCCHNNE